MNCASKNIVGIHSLWRLIVAIHVRNIFISFFSLLFFSVLNTAYGQQTISAPTVAPTTICAGGSVTLTFTVSSNSGVNPIRPNPDLFTAYLSNSSGTGFSSFTTFPTPASVDYNQAQNNAVTITVIVTIPSSTPQGAGYKISISSVNPNYNNTSPYNLNASLAFTVNVAPSAPTTTNTSSCAGIISLDGADAAGCNAGTLNWYDAASGGNLLFTGSPYAPTINTTTTLYVSCKVNGCEGTKAPILITITNVNSGTISADQFICSGAIPAPFTGTAGSGPGNSYKNPTYQWQSGPSSTGPWTDIVGATGQNYPSGTALFATTYFQRQITAVHNGNNGVSCMGYSNFITVTLTAPPSITTHPLAQTVCIGASVTLSVIASSTAPVTYQWKKNGANLVNGGNISGATTASLTINPFAAGDAASYTVVVTNGCASTTSNAAVLSAPGALVAGSFNTTPVTACVNYNPGALTVTGTSGGVSAYTYQWQLSTNGGAFVNVSNTNPYNPANLISAGTYVYKCVVSDLCNTSATTTTKTITIVADPVATIAASGSVCINGSVTLTSTVTGGVTNTYEWQSSPDGVSGWAAIPGAISATYPVITSTAGTFYFRLRIPNAASCNQAISNVVTIVVKPLPTVGVTNNSPICSGSNATFTLTGTSGAVVTLNINGASNQTVTLAGGTATVTVSGAIASQTLNLVSINNPSTSCSQALAGSSTVTVNPKPTPIITHN